MQNLGIENIVFVIFFITIVFVVLVSFLFILLYRHFKKQILNKQKLIEIKSSHENALLKSQLEIQEQTFQNISREIHDNIGQKLTLAKLLLNTIAYNEIESVKDSVNEVISIIGVSIQDLSDISRSMSSEMITNNGLIKALEFEINQLNKPGLFNLRLTVTGDAIFMEAQKELLLFRIVQESLNNIMKHAEATQIFVGVNFGKEFIIVEIKDNGKGFNLPLANHGNGLYNMDKRAKMLNGNCTIHSEKGKGTSITIQIPLYESK